MNKNIEDVFEEEYDGISDQLLRLECLTIVKTEESENVKNMILKAEHLFQYIKTGKTI
jgi:hypothetical protein